MVGTAWLNKRRLMFQKLKLTNFNLKKKAILISNTFSHEPTMSSDFALRFNPDNHIKQKKIL